jgi:hypothetical protein
MKKEATRKSSRGTVAGHPHLTNTLTLTEVQQARLEKFREELGPIASRSQLKAANKKHFGMEASPTYITKNVQFKVKGHRGLYSLVAQSGKAATAVAMKKYVAAKDEPIQYTIRSVPKEVDRLLRQRASQRKQSLNQLILEELSVATVGGQKRADFSDLVGQWTPDPAFDEILAAQRQINWDKWK